MLILSMLPVTLGAPGYIAPIVVISVGYALFQTANNMAVMADVRPEQRGVIAGLLTLSRNLGLVTGASAMGAVFAAAAGDIASAGPAAVASGMRTTFAVAAMLIVVALAIAAALQRRRRNARTGSTLGPRRSDAVGR